MIWFGNIPGLFAQGIMMEHLACPWLSLKKVTDAHKTGHCFIPAFDFAAKLAILRSDFSELAIGKLEKKLMQKSGSKFAAICREDWKEFAKDREELKVGWKSSDRFCAGILCLARGVSCLRLLAAGPVGNCGREEGEAIEAREAKEAIEAGTTTNNQRIQEEKACLRAQKNEKRSK